MKLAIMQPYFFPYIGYFQLMNAADQFVVYDNIEFTKKGWFHRNRILAGGEAKLFTVPLLKAPDDLDVRERELAGSFGAESQKIVRKIRSAYQKAPYYSEVIPLIEECFGDGPRNLFDFILRSLTLTKRFLSIETPLITSSTIAVDHSLKSQDKVIAICAKLEAGSYINPAGGRSLYSAEAFHDAGIKLSFMETRPLEYKQFDHPFVPSLSIIDVMMFNSKERIIDLLEAYSLGDPA